MNRTMTNGTITFAIGDEVLVSNGPKWERATITGFGSKTHGEPPYEYETPLADLSNGEWCYLDELRKAPKK